MQILKSLSTTVAVLTYCMSMQASAGVILKGFDSGIAKSGHLGGWTLTEESRTGSYGRANSLRSKVFNGAIKFRNQFEEDLNLERNVLSWWKKPDTTNETNNKVSTTNMPLVELMLPENTHEINDSNYRPTSSPKSFQEFDFETDLTPDLDDYARNSNTRCESLYSEPSNSQKRGFGNLSSAQSKACDPVAVSEPGTTALLSVGMIGLLLARRQQKKNNR